MVFHFVYEKDFWHILVKFIVYKVSLLSSRPNKKQFQLVDLVNDAYDILTSICNDFLNYRLLD